MLHYHSRWDNHFHLCGLNLSYYAFKLLLLKHGYVTINNTYLIISFLIPQPCILLVIHILLTTYLPRTSFFGKSKFIFDQKVLSTALSAMASFFNTAYACISKDDTQFRVSYVLRSSYDCFSTSSMFTLCTCLYMYSHSMCILHLFSPCTSVHTQEMYTMECNNYQYRKWQYY